MMVREREREDDPFSSGSHEIHLFDMCTEREREREDEQIFKLLGAPAL
jgi:hypothetical protein